MDPVTVLIVCTGNAARSVMAGYMLEHLAASRAAPLTVATAGTHALDGQPMGARTLAAMRSVPALDWVPAGTHRSRQLEAHHLASADLVVAMEADHVRFVRRHHPSAAERTATIRRLARDLAPGPLRYGGLGERVASMHLAEVALGDDEDVVDPAGKDDAAYARCAADLWALCAELMRRL
ncbi:MAG: hypothetical protein ACRDWE_13840 [Acidimicrobiales bacterium]